jgi:precorrin-3B synthase
VVCHHVPVPPENPADRCPGVLRPHQAVDGALLRLRAPGGQLSAAALLALAGTARRYADGEVHLTSRGNLQLRGVRLDEEGTVPAALVDEIGAAGLLPSPTHERVRNIVASPLSGLVGGLGDVRPLVAELDRLVCADPLLAELSGRFLFVVDDGRGDVAPIRGDLSLHVIDAGTAHVLLGDDVAGPEVATEDAAAVLVGLAQAFTRARTEEWHVADLPLRGQELLPAVAGVGSGAVERPRSAQGAPTGYGTLRQDDGRCAVSAMAPLGILTGPMIRELCSVAERASGRLVVTPWRGVVVPDLAPADAGPVAAGLAAAGLVLDPDSPWARITACAGAPGCHRAEGSTGQVAREIARATAAAPADPGALPVHVVACERRCGAPATPHTLVFARRQVR